MQAIFISILLALFAFASLTLAYNMERCDAPPTKLGFCWASHVLYVFDDGYCKAITYGGCGATANGFNSYEDC